MKSDKASLRCEMLKRRAQEASLSASYAITKKIKTSEFYKNAGSVMIYLPIKGEVDVRGLVDDKKDIYVPVTEGGDMYPVRLRGALREGQFGVPEPEKKERFDESALDVVIVPAVALDRSFHRVGFGKGYYDKFLKRMPALKVGVCYEFQLVEEIPFEEHDVTLDVIITEEETLWSKEST